VRDVTLVLFHDPPQPGDSPLVGLLAAARQALAERHVAMFRTAGVARVVVAAGRRGGAARARDGGAGAGVGRARGRGAVAAAGSSSLLPPLREAPGNSFGEALAGVVRDGRIDACVVLGGGAVPRLRPPDARRLVDTAARGGRHALTNNRYSSDVCAVADATALRDLPALTSDNALPRWLEEVAGFTVDDLPGRERLGLDLDTPLDIALLALAADCPAPLRRLALAADLRVPRQEELRAVAADPRRELLVFGRSSSRTLAWLERHVRCRVRFLAEERGMRASSPLAIGTLPAAESRAGEADASAHVTARGARRTPTPEWALVGRPPRATLGRLLDRDGPASLGRMLSELADGAVLDTRVLLADRLGSDEARWPCEEDRFASDLLRPVGIHDPWLAELTSAAAAAPIPILLGGHTLVGPALPLVLSGIR
jgi:hypothetical protein